MTQASRNAPIRKGLVGDFIPSRKSSEFINSQTRLGSLNATLALYTLACPDICFWPFFTWPSNFANDLELSIVNTARVGIDGPLKYTNLVRSSSQALTSSSSRLNLTGGAAWALTADDGLTVGAWVKIDLASTQQGIIGNFNSGSNQRQFLVYAQTTTKLQFAVSGDGTSGQQETVVGPSYTTGQWYFVAGRHTRSPAENAIFVYDGTTLSIVKNSSSYGLLHSTATVDFAIGRFSGTSYLDGDVCLAFATHHAMSDNMIIEMAKTSAPYVMG